VLEGAAVGLDRYVVEAAIAEIPAIPVKRVAAASRCLMLVNISKLAYRFLSTAPPRMRD
jgi:hypothetical protein